MVRDLALDMYSHASQLRYMPEGSRVLCTFCRCGCVTRPKTGSHDGERRSESSGRYQPGAMSKRST